MKITLFFALFLLATAFALHGDVRKSKFSPETDSNDKMAYDAMITFANTQNANLHFVSVVDCETQLVAGKNYFLKAVFQNEQGELLNYEVNVYVQAWTHTAQVTKFVQTGKYSLQKQSVQKKQVDGGFQYFDFTKVPSEYRKFIDSAVSLIGNGLEQRNMSSKFTVERVGIQVVNGMNLKFTIKAENGQRFDVIVYEQPWANVYKITSFEALDAPSASSSASKAFGEFTPFDFYHASSDMKEPLAIASELIGHELEIRNVNTHFKVLEASSQLVNGLNLKFLIELDNEEQYEVVIYEQAWTNTYQIKSFKLKGNGSYGGYTTFDFYSPPKDMVQGLETAKKLMLSELNQRNIDTDYEVVEASYQVVNGANLKFVIQTPNGSQYEVVVFEQPWTHTNKITSFKQIAQQNKLQGFNAPQNDDGYETIDLSKITEEEQIYLNMSQKLIESELEKQHFNANIEVLEASFKVDNGVHLKFLVQNENGEQFDATIVANVFTNTYEVQVSQRNVFF